jgi:hypothetical protein
MTVSGDMITLTCSSCSKSQITTAKEWGHTTSGKCFKMSLNCRAKVKNQYDRTPASVKEEKLQSNFHRYWNDVKLRNSKNEDNKVRSRNKIECPDCKTTMVCGSLSEHKKRCRGHRELTPLEELCLFALSF